MAIPAALLIAQGASKAGEIFSTLEAGKIEQRKLKFDADQVLLNAQRRTNDRLERLLDVMAINNASLGKRGIAQEGSPQNILESDFRKMSRVAQSDLLDARTANISLRSQASAVRRMSRIKAAGSLLGFAGDVGKTGGLK